MYPFTVSHIVIWNDVKHTEQFTSLSPQSHKWNCCCPFQHLTKIKIGTYLKIDTLWGYLSSPLSCWILLSMALICHSKTCPMYLYIGQRIVELALLGLPWLSIDYRTQICVLVEVTKNLQIAEIFGDTWLHRSVSYRRVFRIKFLYFN